MYSRRSFIFRSISTTAALEISLHNPTLVKVLGLASSATLVDLIGRCWDRHIRQAFLHGGKFGVLALELADGFPH
jgi:hypothetical protein